MRGVTSRDRLMAARIRRFLHSGSNIIDVGCGRGGMTLLLRDIGFRLTPVDVSDYRLGRIISDITIYDGKTLPFADKSFDQAILCTVLHHAQYPDSVLGEAVRVSRELIIIETTYRTRWEKYRTVVIDTIGNCRFRCFWRSYKTDVEWEQIFRRMKLRIYDKRFYNDRAFGLPFLHIAYYLKSLS